MFNILAVDDQIANLRLIKALLEDKYSICYATCGEHALEILKQCEFDLIILDIMMPKVNGFEVCEKLRTMDFHKKTPVIFMTAHTDDRLEQKAYDVGGTGFINKPFNIRELKRAIDLIVHQTIY